MTDNTANIGFEETLWKAADKLRGSMDASDYKHVVLGLIFLKYISDKFETKFNALVEEREGFEEDRDDYEAENIFWVPKEARWSFIKDNAKDSKIGQYIDDAMILIEKENPSLKGVLDKRYARPEIDKRRLGELIDLISTIKLHQNGEKDLLGRVYEYFLGQFASVEGKGGGEFYTPTSVVKTLVDMIEPYQGRVYDISILRSTVLPALAHDSLLFPNVSDESIGRILELYTKEKQKQIFISFDRDKKYDAATQLIIKENTVLKLDTDGQALFGWKWGRKDAENENSI